MAFPSAPTVTALRLNAHVRLDTSQRLGWAIRTKMTVARCKLLQLGGVEYNGRHSTLDCQVSYSREDEHTILQSLCCEIACVLLLGSTCLISI